MLSVRVSSYSFYFYFLLGLKCCIFLKVSQRSLHGNWRSIMWVKSLCISNFKDIIHAQPKTVQKCFHFKVYTLSHQSLSFFQGKEGEGQKTVSDNATVMEEATLCFSNKALFQNHGQVPSVSVTMLRFSTMESAIYKLPCVCIHMSITGLKSWNCLIWAAFLSWGLTGI